MNGILKKDSSLNKEKWQTDENQSLEDFLEAYCLTDFFEAIPKKYNADFDLHISLEVDNEHKYGKCPEITDLIENCEYFSISEPTYTVHDKLSEDDFEEFVQHMGYFYHAFETKCSEQVQEEWRTDTYAGSFAYIQIAFDGRNPFCENEYYLDGGYMRINKFDAYVTFGTKGADYDGETFEYELY